MTDKEKIILGVAGSIASLGVGYLIWRHENQIQQVQSAQQSAQNAADEQAYVQELEQSIGSYSTGAGLTQAGYPNEEFFGGASTTEPAGDSDSTLQAILQAFFPTGTSTQTQGGTTTANQPNPTSPVTVAPPASPKFPTSGAGSGVTFTQGGPINAPVANPVQPITNPIEFGGPSVGSTGQTPTGGGIIPRGTPSPRLAGANN